MKRLPEMRRAALGLLMVAGCGGSSESPLFADQDASVIPPVDAAVADAFREAGSPTPQVTVVCTPDAGASGTDPDPAVKRTVSGSNGTFTDACDPSGNLVKQSCATQNICGPGPNPGCTIVETGAVKSTRIDCAGMCENGACASDCPADGDVVTVTSTDGNGNVGYESARSHRHYACTLVFQEPVAYDCKKSPTVGATLQVVGLGLHGSWCTGKGFGNIAVALPADSRELCAMACDITP